MQVIKPWTWIRAALLAVPFVAAQLALSQLQSGLGLQPLSVAVAGEQQGPVTRPTPALRNSVHEQLAKAQAAAEANDLSAAASILDAMIASAGKGVLNSYELANAFNLYAFIHYSRQDYAKALKAYQEVVAQPDIPVAMEINTKYTIAQLYFVQEQWQKGIDALLGWFAITDKPNANAYVLLAQGYYQVEDYAKALLNVEKAINLYKAEDKVPQEQWYNLARFLYFEKGDVNKTVATLEELLRLYPKKDYWVQLSNLYGEQQQQDRQLAAMDTAYVQGMLDKGQEQVTMAYLYLNSDVPYSAGKIMERGLKDGSIAPTSKNYEIAASAWSQARELEKAILHMEKAAAMSEQGDLYARLGNLYLDSDEYEKAIAAINKGLSRGGVKRTDSARLVLGMAYFNARQYDKARAAFNAAGGDERSARYAQQWLQYIDSETQRQARLRDS